MGRSVFLGETVDVDSSERHNAMAAITATITAEVATSTTVKVVRVDMPAKKSGGNVATDGGAVNEAVHQQESGNFPFSRCFLRAIRRAVVNDTLQCNRSL